MVFVGKLIASKGVELLLAAWPLVLAREPRARLLIVGFGAFRAGLEGLAATSSAATSTRRGRCASRDTARELPHLAAFLDGSTDRDGYRAAAARHDRPDRLGRPARPRRADRRAARRRGDGVPSTFPEAFGMVAAEAAACGALPVVADHSGLAEVARTLGAAAPAAARPWLTFDVGPGAVRELAGDLSAWLEAPDGPARRDPRGDRGRHPRALLVGRRRALGDRRRRAASWTGFPRPAPDIGANG